MHYVKKMEYQFKMRKGKDTMNLIINLRWMEYICGWKPRLTFFFFFGENRKEKEQTTQTKD